MTRRTTTVLATALALAALVAGLLAWQFLQDTAKAAFDDACDPITGEFEHASFVLTSNTVTTRGPGSEPELGRSVIRYNLSPHFARHETEVWDEGRRRSESIILVLADRSGTRGDDAEPAFSLVSYVREYDEDYNETGWVTHSEPIGTKEAESSGARSAGSANIFCGMDVDETFTEFEYLGEETIDGILTKHFTGLNRGEPESFVVRTDYWIGPNGLPVQRRVERVQDVQMEGIPITRLVATTKATGYGEQNTITAPIQSTPTPTTTAPNPTPTPVQQEAVTPTPSPTSTPVPVPTDTPEPTETPVPASAWLEPDPETVTFDGSEWLEFTVHGTGVDHIDFGVNVWPGSTGAVGSTGGSSPPSVSEACESTSYTGYTLRDGWTVRLVGCQAGTVIIRLGEYVGDDYDYVLFRQYTVTVSGGP